ncbi:tetratricopeptide repeat protein [Lentisphaerota bacterium WC36G]|nr:tetratricopeptide repeat protein [Lentisphaerae bacterium WC36]
MQILKYFNALLIGSFSVLLYSGCSDGELDPNVELNKAVSQAENGDWESATETAKKLIDNVKDNSDAYVIYGLTCESQGNLEDAIESFKLAVEKDDTNFYGTYNAGRVYLKLKNYPEAVKFLQDALTLKSDYDDCMLLLAQSLTPLMRHKEAVEYYEKLAKLPKYQKSSEIYNLIGVLYSRLGEDKKAFDNLKKSYSLNPNNPEVIFNLAIFVDNKRENTNQYRKWKIQFLNKYLKLTKDNSSLKERHEQIRQRIKKIMRPS